MRNRNFKKKTIMLLIMHVFAPLCYFRNSIKLVLEHKALMEQEKGTKFVRPKSYSDMCQSTLQKMRTYIGTNKQKYISSYEIFCAIDYYLIMGDMGTEVDLLLMNRIRKNYVLRSHKLMVCSHRYSGILNIEEEALEFVELMSGELECESFRKAKD